LTSARKVNKFDVKSLFVILSLTKEIDKLQTTLGRYIKYIHYTSLGNFYHLRAEGSQIADVRKEQLLLSKAKYQEAIRICTKTFFGPDDSRSIICKLHPNYPSFYASYRSVSTVRFYFDRDNVVIIGMSPILVQGLYYVCLSVCWLNPLFFLALETMQISTQLSIESCRLSPNSCTNPNPTYPLPTHVLTTIHSLLTHVLIPTHPLLTHLLTPYPFSIVACKLSEFCNWL
jgi:hypothetical protein